MRSDLRHGLRVLVLAGVADAVGVPGGERVDGRQAFTVGHEAVGQCRVQRVDLPTTEVTTSPTGLWSQAGSVARFGPSGARDTDSPDRRDQHHGHGARLARLGPPARATGSELLAVAQDSWPSPSHNGRAVTDTEYERMGARWSDDGV